MPNGNYKFEPKSILDEEYKIIVVDEISMLPREMWLRLLSHKVHIIACGDPYQLPPIDKDSDNCVLEKPHIFLNEIMRQAYDSEIIRFSMWIREGKPIEQFPVSEKQVMLISPNQVTTGMYEWADQIICSTNATRNEINNLMRKIKGFGDEPQIGDKVISLRNQWEFLSDNKADPSPLTNGTIGTIQRSNRMDIALPYWLSEKKIPILYTNIIDENNDEFHYIPIDYTSLTTGQKFLNGKQEYLMKKSSKLLDPPFEFAYAYGITGHKSQGSEWNKVMVYEERFPFEAIEHSRWAYTVATRASEKLVWVKKG